MKKDKGIKGRGNQFFTIVLFTVILTLSAAVAFAEIALPFGSLSIRSKTQYEFQWSTPPNKRLVPGDSSDQDFEEQLGLDWDWSEKGISFHFLGRYRKDLDGTPNGSVFQDYIDSKGRHREQILPYYGYLEFDHLIPDYDLRIGRQYVFGASQNIQLDGLWLRGDTPFNLSWLSMELYGGLVAEPFADLRRDVIGGINLEFYPVRNLSVHLDSTFYKEGFWDLGADWRPYDNVRVSASSSFIKHRADEAFVYVSADIEKTGTIVGVKLTRNFENKDSSEFIFDWQSPEKDLGKDIKRLYLARERDYTQVDLTLSQHLPIHVGNITFYSRFSIRKLGSSDEEDLYSTDFTSITAGLTLEDLFNLHGFRLSLGLTKWWESRDFIYEAESFSFFADVSQRLFDHLEISGGYYHKTEDVNSLIEDEAANNYYGAVRFLVDESKWAELRYQYERDDYYKEFGISDINSLTATFFIRF